MSDSLKEKLYFPIAWYFRFFASIRLFLWHPRVIVITGSSGKTTLLHLIESQLDKRAKYSHHANSAFGIPFDILDLHRKTYMPAEWLRLFLLAPFMVLTPKPSENLYIVEADCDRPGEGKFLAELLKPEVTLWVSSSKTHSMNFDSLLAKEKFQTTEEAIAYEFGHFISRTSKIAYVNADNPLILDQIKDKRVKIIQLKKAKFLHDYQVSEKGVAFVIDKKKFFFPYLLPEEVSYALKMTIELCLYLKVPLAPGFPNFHLPPGRSSLFKGRKNTTIIDSCYNANLDSMQTVLRMYDAYPGKKKWAVIGDMMEQGKQAKAEHEKLAHLLLQIPFEKLILYGKNAEKYIAPIFKNINASERVKIILEPKELLTYLQKHLSGGETILFKGGRLLEGVIARLLENPADKTKLCRQDAFWERKRKQAGL